MFISKRSMIHDEGVSFPHILNSDRGQVCQTNNSSNVNKLLSFVNKATCSTGIRSWHWIFRHKWHRTVQRRAVVSVQISMGISSHLRLVDEVYQSKVRYLLEPRLSMSKLWMILTFWTGAKKEEIAVMNGLTVNLHLQLVRSMHRFVFSMSPYKKYWFKSYG